MCHEGGCCRQHGTDGDGVTRREVITSLAALAAAGALTVDTAAAQPLTGPLPPKPLRVQAALTYEVPVRQEATSWRPWGGIQTEEQARAEVQRIQAELTSLVRTSGFAMEVLPVRAVRTPEQAQAVKEASFDVLIIYAAGGWQHLFQIMSEGHPWHLMFLRHQPGPVYLWYEIAHPHFLRKAVDEYGEPGWSPDDIVVDSYDRLTRRLRSYYGLKQTLGKRIVALGGAGGWGVGYELGPKAAREIWKLDIVDYSYDDLGKRLAAAMQDSALKAECARRAAEYLRIPGTQLQTTRPFFENAFVLDHVLRQVMAEAKADAITINACMGTIMPISRTTACLPLSLMNDDGLLAFCESDFVVIPSGILLHYISGKPVFLNDPTFPHDGIVTVAHCTAPRKLDGKRREPAKILTHFESDYGASPKVEMRKGQVTTNLVPDFACNDWLGFLGTVVDNPFLDICRSQTDLRIHGDCELVARRMKGFHWMLSYGDYLDEVGYALSKLGIRWTNVSREART